MDKNSLFDITLPYGWIVRPSKTYKNKIYYFNLNSGDTTWECPESVKDALSSVISKVAPCKNPTPVKDEVKALLDADFMTMKAHVSALESKLLSCMSSKLCSTSKQEDKVCVCESASSIVKQTAVGKPVHMAENDDSACTTSQENSTLTLGRQSVAAASLHSSNVEQNYNCDEASPILSTSFQCSIVPDDRTGGEFDSSNSNVYGNRMHGKCDFSNITVPTNHYLVIDTNFLIAHLHHIKKIFKLPIGRRLPHLMIPWIVLQELDHLKCTPKRTGQIAQKRVKYIKEMIGSKHPRFHGQTLKQFRSWAQPFSMNNDDRILECCIHLTDEQPDTKVILLTCDINLYTKSLMCEIEVHDIKSFLKKYHPVIDRNEVPTLNSRDPTLFVPSSELAVDDEEIKKILSSKDNFVIISKAFALLHHILKLFFVAEMKDSFGKSWRNNDGSSNSLSSIIEAILQHWDVVFFSHFNNKIKKSLMFLQRNSSPPNASEFSKEECVSVLTNIEDLFCVIKRRWPPMNISVQIIQDFRVACLQNFCAKDVKVSNIKMKCDASADDVVFNVFDFNWTVINSLCGMIMDFYLIPHSFCYDKPDVIPDDSEFDQMMNKLHPSILKLKSFMSSVVNSDSNQSDLESAFYTDFEEILRNFVSSLPVETEYFDMTEFNSSVLCAYCKAPKNLELLQQGYQQLETFVVKLDEVQRLLDLYKNFSSCKK